MAVTSSDSTPPPIGDTARWLKWIAVRSHIASRQVRSCDGVPARVRGVVSPGTAAFDIAAKADPLAALARSCSGTRSARPTRKPRTRAGRAHRRSTSHPREPAFLLVTQRRPTRVAEDGAMLRALGNRHSDSLVAIARDHAGINRMLGSPRDTTRETEAVMSFVRAVVGRPPRS
jgi:hypothetical protein